MTFLATICYGFHFSYSFQQVLHLLTKKLQK